MNCIRVRTTYLPGPSTGKNDTRTKSIRAVPKIERSVNVSSETKLETLKSMSHSVA